VSDRHIIVNLPPFNLKIVDYILGQTSILGSMSWKPEKGNLILLFDRDISAKSIQLETEASLMWHSLNAYENGREIIAEFVGYQNPDHFIGKDPGLLPFCRAGKGNTTFQEKFAEMQSTRIGKKSDMRFWIKGLTNSR
jgi:all-trans-8'-apo-beta-carotenal 15,15'-oxygenase